jgi:hypothetical protein
MFFPQHASRVELIGGTSVRLQIALDCQVA